MKLRLVVMWLAIKRFFEVSECYKESMGYRCRHRVYPSGFKECGEFPNYWKGDK